MKVAIYGTGRYAQSFSEEYDGEIVYFVETEKTKDTWGGYL